MNNNLLNETVYWEQAVNKLLKKILEYQDLELKEIQFKITLRFIKITEIGKPEINKVIQNTLNSLTECIKFKEKWFQKEIQRGDKEFDYCEIKIEAFYCEECNNKVITFKIPELSLEYVQNLN